jgi:hypothetical protein
MTSGGRLAALSRGAFILAVLLAWHSVEAIRIAPDFLAYFNELVGGPAKGYKHLVDSSLDWGQDLPKLKEWLDREGLQGPQHAPVYLSYFGNARPSYYGIDAILLPGFPDLTSGRRPPRLTGGVYCISATTLNAVYLQDAMGAWTPEYERRYQDVLYNLRGFDGTADDPAARAALIKQTGEEFWVKLFGLYERMRFARLAAHLRERTPDADVGHSILIYRLSEEEVARAIGGSAP